MASHDWIKGDLSEDAAYHDLDLSAIIPKAAIDKNIDFMAAGWCSGWESILFVTKLAPSHNSVIYAACNPTGSLHGSVVCDADRKIDYRLTSSFTSFFITVTGWFVDA